MENGFENIVLPDFAIAGLYNNQLVVIEEPGTIKKVQPEQPKTKQQPLYLGDNKKNILIAVDDETATYLRDEWLQLLSNMLAACKLNIGDVAIINFAKQSFTFLQLKEALQPAFCLLFGVSTAAVDLPFAIPNYQIQKHNQCSFVAAASFDAMDDHTPEAKLEKSKLWAALKSLFNI